MRFLSVYIQTFITPVVSAFLFLGITHLTISRLDIEVGGFSYINFLVPGLSAMAMATSAFANPAFSILIARMQNNLSSIVMAPLNGFEFYSAYVLAATSRGVITGAVVWLCLCIPTGFHLHNLSFLLIAAILGSMLFAHLGYLAGLVALRFEHLFAVMTFGITPLTFLSGGFYLQSQLPETVASASQFNPVFYFIDLTRSSILNIAEAQASVAVAVLVLANGIVGLIACRLTIRGYRLRY